MNKQYIDELDALLGPKGMLPAAQSQPYIKDMQGYYQGEETLVLRPEDTQQVAEAVKICARHQVSIIPQGGHTGLCGGAVPLPAASSVIISTERMNRILSIDPARYSITVEAGVILQSIHDTAHAVDREFAMDWGARGSAMIGGALSTNGGGLNVLRYGTSRDQVLGLEVVLPNGAVWDGLRALRKDASGYDLKQLFVGAEGTLGIITTACVKLHPLQPVNQSMIAALPNFSRLMDLFALARDSAGSNLSAFELIPGKGLRRISSVLSAITQPLETDAEWCVLIRCSGSDAESVEAQLTSLYKRAFDTGLVSDAVISQSIAQESNLWAMRDHIPAENIFPGRRIKWDVSVPIDRIVEFVERAKALVRDKRPQGWFYAFGHVGDGNLHTMIYPGDDDSPNYEKDQFDLVRMIDELVWSLGGSICAEHGVGIENRNRLHGQKSPLELTMMRDIKTLFDPEGLMNPGKLIPDTSPR